MKQCFSLEIIPSFIDNNPKRFISGLLISLSGKIMRYAKISKREIINIRKLYESVMSNACNGLFFSEGRVFGEEIAEIAQKDRDNFFAIATKELKERGWLEEISFDGDTITVKGSIEVMNNEHPTCHRLRGILRHLYEVYRNERGYCVEKKCQGIGDDVCVFLIEPMTG
jgi:predicted hydrocarbon binding protein